MRDLFIKLDSIGARILMLDLRIVVGILSQPTLLLCLRLMMVENFLLLEFDQQDCFIIDVIPQSCRNVIKVLVE